MRRILVCVMMLLGSGDAWAKTGLTDAPSIRHQQLLRKARHELTPAIGATMNDTYCRNMLIQLGYVYHITDWIGVGAEFSYGVGFKTALTSQIESEVTRDPEWLEKNAGAKYQLGRTGLNILALAKAAIVPFSGKIVLFRNFGAYVDFHVNLGGGLAMVKGYGGLDDSTTYAVLVGGGFRFFPMNWWSVNLDVSDYMVPRVLNRAATGTPTEKKFTQNPAFLFGVSFFMPTAPGRGN